ncbi:MAG: tetratricopeptide repeat protein [bacterium]
MKNKITASRMLVVAFCLAVISGLAGCQGMKARLQESENHYEYGLLYLRNGKYNLAFGEFQKARELNSKDARIYNGLGLTYYFQAKFNQAVKEYQRAIELNPQYPEAYNNLSAALAKKEEWPEVIRYAGKALAVSSYTTPELAHFNMGVAYFHLQQYEKARAEFETSLELDANYADTHYHLGLTLMELDQYSAASKSFQRSLELLSMAEGGQEDPLAVDIRYHLALAYLQSNQKDLAAREFQKVIDLAPDSAQAKDAQHYLNTLEMK